MTDFRRTSNTGLIVPEERVSNWINEQMGGNAEQWVEEFISTSTMEALRAAHGIQEWNVELISHFLMDGLRELADAGNLSSGSSTLEVIGNGVDFRDFSECVVNVSTTRTR